MCEMRSISFFTPCCSVPFTVSDFYMYLILHGEGEPLSLTPAGRLPGVSVAHCVSEVVLGLF